MPDPSPDFQLRDGCSGTPAKLTSPSGRVVMLVCRGCFWWLITADDKHRMHGHGVDALVAGMDRVGEQIDGDARGELLSLAATLRP